MELEGELELDPKLEVDLELELDVDLELELDALRQAQGAAGSGAPLGLAEEAVASVPGLTGWAQLTNSIRPGAHRPARQ